MNQVINEKMELGTRDSCQCDECVAVCRVRPGWFLPEEVKSLANNLSISVQNLFKQNLAIDYYLKFGGHEKVFVLIPAVKEFASGDIFAPGNKGECSFLDNEEKCQIHDLGKPFECLRMIHFPRKEGNRGIAIKAWDTHDAQQMIKELVIGIYKG